MHTVSRGKENLKSLQRHDTILLGKLPVMDRTGGPPPNAVFLQHADKPVTPAAFMTSRLISLLKGPGGVIAQPKMHTFQCYYSNKKRACFRSLSYPTQPGSLSTSITRHPRGRAATKASTAPGAHPSFCFRPIFREKRICKTVGLVRLLVVHTKWDAHKTLDMQRTS